MFLYRPMIALFIAANLTGVTNASANDNDCAARMKQVTIRGAGSYAPLGATETHMPLDIELDQTSGCRLSFAFKSAGGNRLSGRGGDLQYQMRNEIGRLIEVDGISSSPSSAFGTGKPTEFRAAVVIPTGQTAQAGVYRDRLSIQLLESSRIVDEREIEVTVRVLPQARIAVSGSAQSGFSHANGASLEFGVLTTGKEREAFLFVQSNSEYALQLRSENGSTMRRLGESVGNAAIAYTVSIDGQKLDLSKPANVIGRKHAFMQAPYSLRARIADVTGKPAGEYGDVITVDVILLE